MCEIKTGDKVIAWDNDHSPRHDLVYLYTMPNRLFVCQSREGYKNSRNDGREAFERIKPAPRYETRVLGPVAMMQALINFGFTCDRLGDWNSPGGDYIFDAAMFSYCGKPKGKDSWVWLDWMLEKVEIKP